MADSDAQSEERLLAIGEASARVGVSVDTMRRWEEEGKITALRTLGGRRRYREADVEALRVGRAEAAS